MVCSFGILLGVIFITLYVALMYNNEAVVLLMYAEAILFVVSLIWMIAVRFFLKVRIEAPISISEVGKENMIKINIFNKLPITIQRMKALVVIEDTISAVKHKHWMKISSVMPGNNEFTHNVTFGMAGNFEINLTKLRVYDMTGLFSGNMKTKSTERVQIMPCMYDVGIRLSMMVKNFYGESDMYDEHLPGMDRSELFQVREYMPGDRLQHVHWKLTAKEDELMVKEHSLPKSCPVILFLKFDPTDKKLRRKNGLAFMESVVSLSYSMLDAGCAHYIVWYAADVKDIVRVRVDDEESLYYFMGMFMKIKWVKAEEDIVLRYKEKHRAETYVWELSLDETLTLRKGEEIHSVFDSKNLEKSLSDTEIVL